MTQVIKSQNMTGLGARFNEIKEAKYASNVREPLAKAFERNYQWPETIKEGKDNHSFGVPTISSDSVKEIVSPAFPLFNAPDVEEMYKKTHGNFAPGEQKERDYYWPVDKSAHRFGFGERTQINGAATALHSERPDS